MALLAHRYTLNDNPPSLSRLFFLTPMTRLHPGRLGEMGPVIVGGISKLQSLQVLPVYRVLMAH